MVSAFPTLKLHYYQSNVEGELVSKIQEIGFQEYCGLVVNAGAYTHTSVALRDAISAISAPTIEVHISNITKRESFRHESMISPVCIGAIFGFGLKSYDLALDYFLKD